MPRRLELTGSGPQVRQFLLGDDRGKLGASADVLDIHQRLAVLHPGGMVGERGLR